MTNRAFIAMLLAYLVPGGGHFFLGYRARAAVFFAIVAIMFAIGLAIDGGLYSPMQGGGLLRLLASLGTMGAGVFYFAGAATGPHGDMTSITYEYGSAFLITAGLMNLLLVLDAFDLAEGRKE